MVETIMMACFHFFYKQLAQELAPKLAVIFRHLVNGGSLQRNLTKMISQLQLAE